MEFNLYGVISEDERRQTYVFGSHQFALYYWTKEIHEEKLPMQAQLIHIDYHADSLPARYVFDGLLKPEEIKKCIENQRICNDSFIKPAISMGIIQDIAFCCYPSRNYDFLNFRNYETPIAIVDLLSKHIKGEQLPEKEKLLCSNIVARNLILDIDIDYFLMPNRSGGFDHKKKCDIKREMDAINRLYEFASVTTIATSPSPDPNSQYSRNLKYAEKLFREFFACKIDFKEPSRTSLFNGLS